MISQTSIQNCTQIYLTWISQYRFKYPLCSWMGTYLSTLTALEKPGLNCDSYCRIAWIHELDPVWRRCQHHGTQPENQAFRLMSITLAPFTDSLKFNPADIQKCNSVSYMCVCLSDFSKRNWCRQSTEGYLCTKSEWYLFYYEAINAKKVIKK